MQHRFIVFFFLLTEFYSAIFFLGTASVFFFNCSIAVIWGVVSLLRSEVMCIQFALGMGYEVLSLSLSDMIS